VLVLHLVARLRHKLRWRLFSCTYVVKASADNRPMVSGTDRLQNRLATQRAPHDRQAGKCESKKFVIR
jgi:hypothetical protein